MTLGNQTFENIMATGEPDCQLHNDFHTFTWYKFHVNMFLCQVVHFWISLVL